MWHAPAVADQTVKRRVQAHRVPAWWLDAKLGIFIHWTPASVIGWAPTDREVGDIFASRAPDAMASMPYTEWYQNSLRFPDGPAARYHREHFGHRPYDSFADDFQAGLAGWDPEAWADRFARAGARYVVLVTKHHDGFCLWPTSVPNPNKAGWHTERDVVGELADAVRARGLRFGVYYSGGLDWTFDDRPLGTTADVAASVPGSDAYADYAEAHVRELIERYRPSVLWNDIAWPFSGDRLWRLFAHYYDAVPDGVVNDRWLARNALWEVLRFGPVRNLVNRSAAKGAADGGGMVPPTPPHYDVRTPEYTTFPDVQKRPWECVRGIDASFGFNRASDESAFLPRDELVEMVADITAKGGNLLLNVGPRGEDATIPDAQLRRLDWLGEWLAVAGPAVYATRPWVRPEGTTAEGDAVRYTASGDAVHALVQRRDPATVARTVTLREVVPGPAGSVQVAGGEALAHERTADGTRVDISGLDASHPWPLALTITHAEAVPGA